MIQNIKSIIDTLYFLRMNLINTLYPSTEISAFNNEPNENYFSFSNIESNEPYALNVAQFFHQLYFFYKSSSNKQSLLMQQLVQSLNSTEIIELIFKNYLYKIKVTPYTYESSALESFKTLNLIYELQFDSYFNLLKQNFQLIIKVLVNSYSWSQSNQVPQLFTCGKLSLVQMLTQSLKMIGSAKLPDTIWDLLIKWFIEYKSNNVYQNYFIELLKQIMKQSQLRVLSIMIKLNLISEMYQALQRLCPNGIEVQQLQLHSFCQSCKRIYELIQQERANLPELMNHLNNSSSWMYLQKYLLLQNYLSRLFSGIDYDYNEQKSRQSQFLGQQKLFRFKLNNRAKTQTDESEIIKTKETQDSSMSKRLRTETQASTKRHFRIKTETSDSIQQYSKQHVLNMTQIKTEKPDSIQQYQHSSNIPIKTEMEMKMSAKKLTPQVISLSNIKSIGRTRVQSQKTKA